MPRFYNDRMRPSANKAATPGEEKKAGKPSGGTPDKGKGKDGAPDPGDGKSGQGGAENGKERGEGGGE